jgi:uncharacterized membrane protein YraQ (UPF0718 family)
MTLLYVATAILVLASFAADRQRTVRAVRTGCLRFLQITPAFLCMLILVSVVLYLVPEDVIVKYLARDNRWTAMGIASVLGSVSIMPGFIAFPLAGILLGHGVSYMVLSAFTTTLMMVGVLTYPMERAFLGGRVAVIRNVVSFLIALAVAAATGVFFGEVW